MVTFSLASYEEYAFPLWADVLGILIGVTTLVPLPVMAVYTIFKRKYVSTQIIQRFYQYFSLDGVHASLTTSLLNPNVHTSRPYLLLTRLCSGNSP